MLSNDLESLWFDYNVMLLGLHAELEAREDKRSDGFTSTRREAVSLARRARLAADAIEAEAELN